MSGAEAVHPERIVPEEVPAGILNIHLRRYVFAEPFVADRDVLDVACGVGYGAYRLRDARSVCAVDLDRASVAHGAAHYRRAGLAFLQGDAAALPFRDASFDTVCSFETIEHVPDVERYLREMRRVLRPGGAYLVSTPVVPRTTRTPANPFHFVEFSPSDFARLLGAHFREVALFTQRRRESTLARLVKRLDVLRLRARLPLVVARTVARGAGHRTTADLLLDDVEIAPGILARGTETLAVCRP